MIVAFVVSALICGLALGRLWTERDIDRILADKSPEERKALERRVRARRVLRGEA